MTTAGILTLQKSVSANQVLILFYGLSRLEMSKLETYGLAGCLQTKFYWNIIAPIHLHAVLGPKAEDIYAPALSRKSLLAASF